MPRQEIPYFIGTLGSGGYTDFYDSNFSHLANRRKLYGYPTQCVENLIHTLLERAAQHNLSCDIIYNFLDAKPEGVIIPEKGTGFVNVPLYLLTRENILGMIDDEHVSICKRSLSEAEKCFREAKKIHDEWEKIYVANMDFGAADSLADESCRRIIGDRKGKEDGRIIDRFLGAATAEGSVDKIESITANVTKRYFIKGRPGTGKSTFLRKIVRAAQKNGFDAEQYHCSFDPSSLDMAVIRGLDVCLFDSTAPHEYFPSRPNDEIIDIYATAVTPGTDEKYEKELFTFQTEYKFKVLEARKTLSHARSAYEKTEAYYMAKIDMQAWKQAEEELCSIMLQEL